jgi:hypothetical protein
MNKLEAATIEQYQRIRAAGPNGHILLGEAQGEIMAAATPEFFEEILVRTSFNTRVSPQNSPSHASRLALAGLIAPQQGYVGGIIDGEEPVVYAYSARTARMEAEGIQPDLIQQAMGEAFYPPMALAKAVRAAAYEGRNQRERHLSVAEYLAGQGLTLGSNVAAEGDFVGATGFMPGRVLLNVLSRQDGLINHVIGEPIVAFRASGLSDQIVIDPSARVDPATFAANVLQASGSLN